MFEFKKPGLSFLKKKKKKKDVFGKGGAASGNKILRRDLKNSYRDPHISKTVGKLRNLSYFLVFKWYKRFSDDRENVMDGVQEGKPSFQNCESCKMKFVALLTVIGD